jgi:hypothetical protein
MPFSGWVQSFFHGAGTRFKDAYMAIEPAEANLPPCQSLSAFAGGYRYAQAARRRQPAPVSSAPVRGHDGTTGDASEEEQVVARVRLPVRSEARLVPGPSMAGCVQ